MAHGAAKRSIFFVDTRSGAPVRLGDGGCDEPVAGSSQMFDCAGSAR
jgi:hypothetical protein